MLDKSMGLLREQFSEFKGYVLGTTCFLILYAVFLFYGPRESVLSFLRVIGPGAYSLPLVCTSVILVFLLAHSTGNDVRLDYPRRHLVLPVSTVQLVTLRLSYILLVLTPLSVITHKLGLLTTDTGEKLYYWLFIVHPIQFLSCAACLFAISCLSMVVGDWAILLLVSPLIIGMLYLTSPFFRILETPGNHLLFLSTYFIGTVGAAWLIALLSLKYARHGETIRFSSLFEQSIRILPLPSRDNITKRGNLFQGTWSIDIHFPWVSINTKILSNRKTFNSPLAAQTWFEWRRCVQYFVWCAIPLFIGFALLITIEMNRTLAHNNSLLDVFIGSAISVIVVAFVVGGYLLLCNKNYIAFVGTKPLSDNHIAKGKYFSVLRAILCVLALWILLVYIPSATRALSFIGSVSSDATINPLDNHTSPSIWDIMTNWPPPIFIPLLFLGLITWITLLSGRLLGLLTCFSLYIVFLFTVQYNSFSYTLRVVSLYWVNSIEEFAGYGGLMAAGVTFSLLIIFMSKQLHILWILLLTYLTSSIFASIIYLSKVNTLGLADSEYAILPTSIVGFYLGTLGTVYLAGRVRPFWVVLWVFYGFLVKLLLTGDLPGGELAKLPEFRIAVGMFFVLALIFLKARIRYSIVFLLIGIVLVYLIILSSIGKKYPTVITELTNSLYVVTNCAICMLVVLGIGWRIKLLSTETLRRCMISFLLLSPFCWFLSNEEGERIILVAGTALAFLPLVWVPLLVRIQRHR